MTAPTPAGLPPQFGPHCVVRRLDRGGMGTVYLATDTRLDRRVALKVCHRADSPQALERFKREAAILGTPWDRYGKHCRAACRNQFAADFLNNFLGFRVAVTAGPP